MNYDVVTGQTVGTDHCYYYDGGPLTAADEAELLLISPDAARFSIYFIPRSSSGNHNIKY